MDPAPPGGKKTRQDVQVIISQFLMAQTHFIGLCVGFNGIYRICAGYHEEY
jgi:hypothetical protein